MIFDPDVEKTSFKVAPDFNIMSPKICSDEDEDEEAASFDVKDVADGNDDKANKLDKTG